MIKIFVTLGLLLFFQCFAFAGPCEQMQLQINNTNADTTFNPTVAVTVTIKGDTIQGGCDFFLDASYGGASSFNGRQMYQGSEVWPYEVLSSLSPVQHIKWLPQVTASTDVLTGVMPGYMGNDTQVTKTFWIQRDNTNPWRAAGNYTNSFTVTLYKGTISNPIYVSSRQMTLNNNAQKRVDISVLPSGGSFDINHVTETLDFGPLSTGQTKSCDIRIKTNSGYKLSATSLNNGRLKHESDNKFIPYSTKFAGEEFSLNTTREVASASSNQVVSPASGILVPVSVTIGNMNNPRSGNYSDTITLSVTAQ